MHVIEMDRVGKRFGATHALRGIDLRVEPGERVAVLGPNGAGKTTAIEIMLGLQDPSEGRVRLFGGRPDGREVRARVGAMLQASGVPENLTVREVVRLFRRLYPHALPSAELIARADLVDKADAQVRSMSGGQKQRLSFALALAGDPDLLFLDEPTSAMDVEARRTFWDQVRELSELGKTVLFTTHALDEVEEVATRVVVVHRGRILIEGSPAEIKGRVAAKTLRMRTDASLARLSALPGVRSATRVHDHVELVGADPEGWLATLFAERRSVVDLSVVDADLETAFVRLTRAGGTVGEVAA